jgi:hypothetical protein
MKTQIKRINSFLMMGLTSFIATTVLIGTTVEAREKTVRKVQEVSFDEMDLKGTVRNPDGAYLVQKRGIKFMPLVDVKKNMDEKIRDSVQYVR